MLAHRLEATAPLDDEGASRLGAHKMPNLLIDHNLQVN
jgi:hypothetical protein